MSLLNALRSGVAVADKVTKSFQGTILYEHPIGRNGYGPVYAQPVSIVALIDMTQRMVRTRGGELVASRGTVTFLNVQDIANATSPDGYIRDEGRITLPNGLVCAILSAGGFVDAGTTFPVATTVALG